MGRVPVRRGAVAHATSPPVDGDRFDSGRERMRFDGVRWHRRLDRELEEMGHLEGLLWGAVALVLVGDVVTTFVGLHLGLVESNPVAARAIDGWGVVGMLVLKVLAVAVALCCRPLLSREYRPIVPAGLAVPWSLAVGINLIAISTVV